MYQQVVKRVLDTVLALFLLLLTSPIFAVAALLIKLSEPDAPVIFQQPRAGKLCRSFTLYKFRTMRVSAPADAPTWALEDADSHISPLGKFLRATSIDELPQLVNILKGDMSFVGPRPVIFQESELIEKRHQCGVYSVLPGLTGYAQINGRDDISLEEKVRLDKVYAENISFLTDASILLQTIPAVLFRKGISEGKSAENGETDAGNGENE